MVGGKEPSQLLDGLLFPGIFQTFRMSIQPTKLIITSCALAIICVAGYAMDRISRSVVGRGDGMTELELYLEDPGALPQFIEQNKSLTKERKGVFSKLWKFAGSKFKGAVVAVLYEHDIVGVADNIAECFKGVGWALWYHPVYCLIFFAITLAVMSVAGGAICRIAALQFARGEKPGLTEALRFSTKRFTSFFAAPLTPICIMAFIGIFILLLGLIGNIPRAGEILIGISMPLALGAGFLIAVILVGSVAGLNLMFPAVAYDGSDCFDSISRSFSYIYARPWRMGFYTAVAAVYGSICYTFVRVFAFLTLWITHWLLQISLWAENGSGQVNKLAAIWPRPEVRTLFDFEKAMATNWTESVAVFLVTLFVLVVIGLVVSFIISFYFSANTIIYSLMRYKVDNTAREDIYMPHEDPESELSQVDPRPKHLEDSAPQSAASPEATS